ncbi:MAG TPA: UDP-N-acetylglucosamine 1-carboxyvinyltransferase [Phenylobacterium sp.]|jgi:UDP-N-acetylglucosamine 1-carboxyvinyltransferase|uniref:UDP-N-acetylglucosamine 1-carboxyvinyltransferase n=1 Tax=Phenylobacterium sp. TaxID=1871053 RepID=UPI002D04C907|nr:UDP-N-acetylglucosamine 1-carboxyvinyltransferase [Phenylobacterium sp.]HXA37524.1 UDP-N-acetylglucosamine 1-carboxyvinyltransferase [Phenylobacterium sp.]
MDRLIVRGGRPLDGTVDIAGAKNSALPLIAASLLSERPLVLTRIPAVTDVDTLLSLVESYGVRVDRDHAHQVTLDAAQAVNVEAHYDVVRRARATVLVLGPLLARFGSARVSLPGGCAIGARPIDLHLMALSALGAEVSVEGGYVEARAPGGLTGARIVLSSPSVGATETAMMAATRARGETEILNAAREPEVADLAACLIAMGARIEGAGTHRILVAGDATFQAAAHELISDRIEAGTYAVAAAITGGRLELIGARLEHLGAECQVLERAGARVFPTDRGLMVERTGRLSATDVSTEPFPGFPTDLQAQFMALMSVAEGAALIRETIFENRFMHVPELMRLGADLTLRGTTVMVRGVERLRGAPVMATDLRASVCLILAGLVAEGETVVSRVYHLDRGYEDLARKLVRCGADIERESE